MPAQRVAQCIVVLAFALTLWRLGRALPWQNVAACVALIMVLSGVVEMLGATTGIPFGSFRYTDNLGHRLFQQVPWPVPLLWVVILLNARGVARLILHSRRGKANYGLWVIGLSALLAMLFDAGLEPIASCVREWWIWNAAKSVPTWYGAPWTNFIGWFVASALMLICAAPWLINKRLSSASPPDWFSLWLWLILTLLLVGENLAHGFWVAAILILVTDVVIAFLIWSNTRGEKDVTASKP